jgi:hypothetical protein
MFRLGIIISINEADNIVKIKDLYNYSVYDIRLNNHIHFQSMPLAGDIVLYLNFTNKIFKIIKIWQIKEDNIKRSKEFLLKSGELQLQGIYGQYIYLDNNGTIKFVDSTMLNEFELSFEGFIAKLKKFQLETYNNIKLSINDEVLLQKTVKDDNIYNLKFTDENVSLVVKNNKATILIDKQGNITITGSEVIINGNTVKLGDSNQGDIVTSGPFGTFPICPITGSPIKGSSKCKAEG